MKAGNPVYTDAALMAMLRSRHGSEERKASDSIYGSHCQQICAQLRRSGCDPADAEDAFQHAVASFWVALADEGFEISESIGAWLHTVARRHWLNQLSRKQQLDKVAADLRQERPDEPASEDAEAILHKILAQLDAQCRMLLELRFLKGLDRTQMAVALGYANVESVSNRTNTCRDRAKQIARDLGYRGIQGG